MECSNIVFFKKKKIHIYGSNEQSLVTGDFELETDPKFGKNALKLPLKAKG